MLFFQEVTTLVAVLCGIFQSVSLFLQLIVNADSMSEKAEFCDSIEMEDEV